MKKFTLLFIVLIILICTLSACSAKNDNGAADNSSNPVASSDKSENETNNSDEYNLNSMQLSDKKIEDAEISSSDACKKITDLDFEKLALEGKKDDYKFMVSTQGKVIDGEDYIEVVASVVTEENADGSLNMVTKGQYFVSYNGKKILMRNNNTGDYSELK